MPKNCGMKLQGLVTENYRKQIAPNLARIKHLAFLQAEMTVTHEIKQSLPVLKLEIDYYSYNGAVMTNF